VLVKWRADRRITSSRLLPEIRKLKAEGLSHWQVGERLGITHRQVEHVLFRHRRQEA
jgi:hypothetical protein